MNEWISTIMDHGMTFRKVFVNLLLSAGLVFVSVASYAASGAQECSAIFSDVARQSEVFLPIDLAHEIEASGLSPHISWLQRHSRGVMDMYTFLELWPSFSKGYALGISEQNLIYEAISHPMGLLGWGDGYFKHRLHRRAVNHTRDYMTAILASGEPIVFLVPRDLMNRPGLTQHEMLFLLDLPADRLKNVLFVFGAYHFISEEAMDKINRRGGANTLRDELRQWVKQNKKP